MIKAIFEHIWSYVVILWHFVGQWKYGNLVRWPIAIFLAFYLSAYAGWYVVRPPYQWITTSYEQMEVINKYIKNDKFYVSLKKANGQELNAVVEDSWIWFTWNASDRYRDLKVGHKMMLKVPGIRWDFMSWFPNVVRVGKVDG